MQVHHNHASNIPGSVIPEISVMLFDASRVLGMFEAHEFASKTNSCVEHLCETDETTRLFLVDLHDRAFCVISHAGKDAKLLADTATLSGFRTIRSGDDGIDLGQIRKHAHSVIAEGFTLGEKIPEFELVNPDQLFETGQEVDDHSRDSVMSSDSEPEDEPGF